MRDKSILHSFKWVGIWMAVALAVAAAIYMSGHETWALEFLGCYLLEFSLSMDNMFVFLSIFASFAVPEPLQHRCLAYGIIGAIVLRFLFIALGATIVNSFSWVLYIFGVVLLYSAYNMLKSEQGEEDASPHDNRVLRLMTKILPVTDDFVGNKFFTRQGGRLLMTPLFAVLIVIESSDIIFAIDSVPAAFSVSTHMMIIYFANILAIMGMRQLFFVIEHMQNRFCLMKYGVALILAFTGLKLLLLIADIHISIPVSIGFIVSVLAVSIVSSLLYTRGR